MTPCGAVVGAWNSTLKAPREVPIAVTPRSSACTTALLMPRWSITATSALAGANSGRQELPRIKRRRAYELLEVGTPDWRITCYFVDSQYRGQGVAAVALHGALREIARLGGGLVESFPEDVTDRRTAAGFLHNATTSVFERQGFTREQQLGKHHLLMTKRFRRSAVR
jgi:hypothetical protein